MNVIGIKSQISSIYSPEGGLLVTVINKTGEDSVKGKAVDTESTVNNGVNLVEVGGFDAVGIIYDSGIADGEEMRIVVAGVAEVLYINAATRGYFARINISADADDVPGGVISEPLPSPPLATDKHFREIGHVIETIASPGLAKTIIHFN